MTERKPGAGLGQLFRDDEAPTGKLPTIELVEREKCPTCHGTTLLDLPDRADVKRFIDIELRRCPDCVDGKVDKDVADAIRRRVKP